jgi:N12 class adenine-specific DNA methylase
VPVNRYFQEHPENVLGDMTVAVLLDRTADKPEPVADDALV